jgi:hypothetical protein
MPSRQTKEIGKAHRFGGNWTTDKLDVIPQYLRIYNSVTGTLWIPNFDNGLIRSDRR